MNEFKLEHLTLPIGLKLDQGQAQFEALLSIALSLKRIADNLEARPLYKAKAEEALSDFVKAGEEALGRMLDNKDEKIHSTRNDLK